MTPKIAAIKKRLESADEWEINCSLYTDAQTWNKTQDCGLILKADDKKLYGKMSEIMDLFGNAPADIKYLLEVVRVQREALEAVEVIAGQVTIKSWSATRMRLRELARQAIEETERRGNELTK